MLGRLILWSALWVTLLGEWLPLKNEAKFKKNLVLGVTLPKEAQEDPGVQQILQNFRKKMNVSCLILLIPGIAGVFIPDLTASLICWTVMLVFIMVVPMVVYALENRQLKALKKQRSWTAPRKNPVRVDTRVMIDYPKPKLWGYLFCAALCAVPMAFQRSIWWVHLMDLGIALLSYLFAVLCYRKKSETVDGDPERTKALSQLRYRKWKQIWLLCAWCGVLTSYSLWVMALSPMVGMSLVVVSSVFLCAALLGLEMQTRKQQEQLTQDSGKDWYADEDDYWLGGMFYCNPNDAHLMVNARTGMGTTVNLATFGGKLFTVITMAVLVGSLVWLADLALEDKSDIRLEISEEAVICENGGTRYEVPMEEIESAELLDELPKGLWRTWGTGGQYLAKGSFYASGMPDLKLILDPTTPPYLLIRTASGTDYLFGARDAAWTKAVFEYLRIPKS